MNEYQSILTEVDGCVGILTMNKPQRHNAFDEQLIAEMTAGLRELAADPNGFESWCCRLPARASAPAPICSG
jgi:enoyl-CoA hydratase/carnithine racemase